MNRTLLAALLFLLSLNLHAETIFGRVLDAENEVVAFATVMLFNTADSAMVKAGYTEDEGQFTLENFGAGIYTADLVAVAMVREMAPIMTAIGEGRTPKGNIYETARIAGIQSAKLTPQLIPLCHPLLLTKVDVAFEVDERKSLVEIKATVRTRGKTGVEMEALTAVSVAALTLYDMAKAVEKGMRIQNVRLIRKSGGKSGDIVLE